MAFTVSQQLDICTILEVELPVLEYALTFNVQYIDATAETKVIALIAEWNGGVRSDYVKIHPREANRGVEINANNPKDQIRREMATLLLMTETVFGGKGARAQVQILRG